MAKKKLVNISILMVILIFTLTVIGCSNHLMGDSSNAVPPDLRNTKWAGQGSRSNIILAFGTDGVNVSGTGTQWDGWCRYGSYGSGYGCCGFINNNGTEFNWEYTCRGNTLTVWNCSNPQFNGQWTKLQ